MSWQEDRKDLIEELSHLRQELRVERRTCEQLMAQNVQLHTKLNSNLTEDEEVCECGNRAAIDMALHERFKTVADASARLSLFIIPFMIKVKQLCLAVGPTPESEAVLRMVEEFNAESKEINKGSG